MAMVTVISRCGDPDQRLRAAADAGGGFPVDDDGIEMAYGLGAIAGLQRRGGDQLVRLVAEHIRARRERRQAALDFREGLAVHGGGAGPEPRHVPYRLRDGGVLGDRVEGLQPFRGVALRHLGGQPEPRERPVAAGRIGGDGAKVFLGLLGPPAVRSAMALSNRAPAAITACSLLHCQAR